MSIYLLVLMACVICLKLLSFYRKMPQLKLTHSGIELSSIIGSQFHRWDDVGEFNIRTQKSYLFDTHYLCAYSLQTQKALQTAGNFSHPDIYDSDIRMILMGLTNAKLKEELEKLVSEVNAWRDRYRSQETIFADISEVDVSKTQTNVQKRRNKRKLFIYISVIMVTVIILYFSRTS